jgi:hypothetical protein
VSHLEWQMPGIFQRSGYVLRALRDVQWDLSFKGSTKAYSRLDSLIRRDRECWDKFSAFIKDSPHRSSLKHLNDGGSSDAARSLTFRVRWSPQTPGSELL